jgi:hypothetical protein
MTWFYNSRSGELTSASGLAAAPYAALAHAGIGWHQLKIPATATEAQAAAEAVKEVPGGAAPTTSIAGGAAQAVTSVASGAATSAVNDALKPLFQASIWLRVAEVALGVVLIAIGLAKITHAVPAATRIAGALA